MASVQARDVLRRKGSVLRMVLYFAFVPVFLMRGIIFGRIGSFAMVAVLLGLGTWFALPASALDLRRNFWSLPIVKSANWAKRKRKDG